MITSQCSATLVSAEPFPHRTETLQCLQKEMATYRHWSVLVARPRRCLTILSPDKTEWQLTSATLCRWKRCFVADQLWFMTRKREEEEEEEDHNILLTCLSSWFGIHGTALRWFRSYLSSRCFCVKCNNDFSSSHTCICGVPKAQFLALCSLSCIQPHLVLLFHLLL